MGNVNVSISKREDHAIAGWWDCFCQLLGMYVLVHCGCGHGCGNECVGVDGCLLEAGVPFELHVAFISLAINNRFNVVLL